MHSYKPIGLICLCINENVGCYFYILHLVLNYRTRHIELGAIFLCNRKLRPIAQKHYVHRCALYMFYFRKGGCYENTIDDN